jgi:hypothetical protein
MSKPGDLGECRRCVETAREPGAGERPDALDGVLNQEAKPKKLVRPDVKSGR